MPIINYIILVLGTILIVRVSRSSLRHPDSHGFYRFFAWETILVMFVLNSVYWFRDPFSPSQIISWVLLITSLVLIILGVKVFLNRGNIGTERNDPTLAGIERTTSLVTAGLYKYIRHPFYSSLLFLAWGIAIKRITWYEISLAVLATIFLFITARKEEAENVKYFGVAYRAYMRRTKMFIPFVL